jgi:hypothetical protein
VKVSRELKENKVLQERRKRLERTYDCDKEAELSSTPSPFDKWPWNSSSPRKGLKASIRVSAVETRGCTSFVESSAPKFSVDDPPQMRENQ